MYVMTRQMLEQSILPLGLRSRERQISKSDIVRERLATAHRRARERPASIDAIADLIGSVDGLPSRLSARRKAYLKKTTYGRKRTR